jgi:cbb3-type cytochrome oxidase maturation protein
VEILYLLVPLSIVLVAIIVAAFLWAIRSGQFDDLEGPAHSILMDDDEPKGNEGSDDSPPESNA